MKIIYKSIITFTCNLITSKDTRPIPSFHYLFIITDDRISLLQPLEGTVGREARVYCRLNRGTGASILILRINGQLAITDKRITTGTTTATQKEFIINPVLLSDDGAIFNCGAAEIMSPPVTFSAYREFNRIAIPIDSLEQIFNPKNDHPQSIHYTGIA